MPSPRRFSPPWTAEVTPNCFIVRDADGQQLAYVYFESEPGRRSAKLLTKDEARRIAANIAKPVTEDCYCFSTVNRKIAWPPPSR